MVRLAKSAAGWADGLQSVAGTCAPKNSSLVGLGFNPETEDWVLATHVPELFWFPELQATKSTVPQRPPPLPNASLKPPSLPKKLSEPLQNDSSKLSNSIVAPSVQKKLKQNYFGRHWRGELPLYVSYSFNGTAGYIVITVVRHFLDYANQG